MIVQIKNHRQIILERLMPEDYDNLSAYLQHLSPDSKKRFGPHGFDLESIYSCYKNPDHSGYIARDAETQEIIAYSIIKTAYLEHDSGRLRSYGLALNKLTDCTFAPSVADEWQSLGVGKCLFRFVLSELKVRGIKRIILWGGVQCDNYRAVNYYIHNGFRTLGQFEYNGLNADMILEIL